MYNYVDHLGNIRLSYADSDRDGNIRSRDQRIMECSDGNCIEYFIPGEIVANNNYYPFGMLFDHNAQANSSNAYKYKYNGKELQETGFYDYGWRQYMPDIGRWLQMDPLAERDRRWSPYRYAYDNPLRFIDPDGLWELEIKQREIMKKGQGTGKFENYLAFVAQEGDNINTLAEQTGLDLEQLQKGLEGVEIKEGSSLDKLGIASADKMIGTINKYINDQRKAFDSNCWGTSVSMGRRGSVDFNVDGKNTGTIPDPNRADEILQDEFKQTNNPSFGDLRRYAYSDGNKRLSKEFNDYGYNIVDSGNKAGGTSHYATYLLNNGAGTVYVFSKNGAGASGKWVVTPERHITGDNGYGNPTPIGSGSPNYTKK
ncbi:hypothetical protein IX39_16100 [Chryseobacterium formosense]|uniref:RHS repeat-associated core domain-containing protein n=1 Tax=Chryseobacterium formosense TaxID=236814 RepID=A0A085Z3B3_9FLAO|nr:RHS repeat-associated core domain-containing protein [Chryseobacterium formosense]KFE98926.1 hypothetical protein IX39_16100 [Chryseobacterium formosense]SFT59226.1 RHS repeat-associated core domain-containing protein [Chryseobacterium formosense]